jgi:hypothetical protein
MTPDRNERDLLEKDSDPSARREAASPTLAQTNPRQTSNTNRSPMRMASTWQTLYGLEIRIQNRIPLGF